MSHRRPHLTPSVLQLHFHRCQLCYYRKRNSKLLRWRSQRNKCRHHSRLRDYLQGIRIKTTPSADRGTVIRWCFIHLPLNVEYETSMLECISAQTPPPSPSIPGSCSSAVLFTKLELLIVAVALLSTRTAPPAFSAKFP